MRKKNGLAIASAAATLILASAVGVRATSPDEKAGGKVMCEGVNECKGKGSCATAQNSCAGENACKGKGALSMTKEDCDKKGGKVTEKKKM